jgi:hypothetical protein
MPHRRPLALLMLVVTASVPSPLWCQQPELAIGTRVRVTAVVGDTTLRFTGTTRGATPDSLWLATDDPERPAVLPWSDVRKLEQHAGRRSNAGRGAAVGALVGGLGMGVTYWQLTKDTECSTGGWSFSVCLEDDTGSVLAATGFGMLLGAGLGAAIGAASKSDRWRGVTPPPLTVTPTMREGKPGVALSWRF